MANLPERLKIGLVIDTSLDTTEGVPQYVVTVGEWLRGQGHDVHYLAGQSKRQDLENLHSLSRNIGVRFNGNRLTIPLPTSRRRLRRFVRDEQFDVLHVQTPHHPLMAQHVILAASPATAVIGTFHILPYDRLTAWGARALGIWLRPSLKRVDAMLAVSGAAAEFCRQCFRVPAKVVPNAFDYRRFHEAQPLPRDGDARPTILFLGRLVPRKGCRLLLEAAAQLVERDDLPDFRVVICGSGPLKAEFERFIEHHNLSTLVKLAGFVSEEDKPRYYAAADLAVFPSSGGESFGIVLLEAMASGRPVVLAGDNPGYRSVMVPRPELLFSPTDADRLADLLAHYIKDAPARREAGLWAANYSRRFDVNVVGRQLLEEYRRALRKRRRA